MSMAHSLEVRAPYLDADLVEYAVSTAPRHKLDPRRNKALLLDAVGPALPREVWDRPKMGFGLPYQRWLREGLALGATSRAPRWASTPGGPRRASALRTGASTTRAWPHAARRYARWARRERMSTTRLRHVPGG